jgi:hypothetical protein
MDLLIVRNNESSKKADLQILDPLIQKQYKQLPNKSIKLVSKSNLYYINIKNSAINSFDPNLYIIHKVQ